MHVTDSWLTLMEKWHDFYLLVGTAAATLLGLLFVSLSMNLEVIVDDDGAHLNALAFEAFFSFALALVVSIIMLAPGVGPRPIGVNLVVLGLIRLIRSLANVRKVLSGGGVAIGRGLLLLRVGLPALASLALAWCGWNFLRGSPDDGTPGMVGVMIVLLVSGTGIAWDLMIRVGRHKLQGRRK